MSEQKAPDRIYLGPGSASYFNRGLSESAVCYISKESSADTEYIRADLAASQQNKIQQLENELAESTAIFNLRWNASMRAYQRWRESGGDELTWPDHADLCVWLMEQLKEQDWTLVAEMPSEGRVIERLSFWCAENQQEFFGRFVQYRGKICVEDESGELRTASHVRVPSKGPKP